MSFDPDAYLKNKAASFDPDKYLASKTPQEESGILPTLVDKFAQGGSAGFADEFSGALEAAGQAAGVEGLGGKIKDIKWSDHGPTADWEVLKHAYMQARNKDRQTLKQESEDHPLISGAAELGGALMSPVNKLIPEGASGLKTGAIIGASQGLGNSEAEDLGGMAKDTALGAGVGSALGYVGDKAAPYLEKAAQKVGEKFKDTGENLMVKAGGATLRDFRALHGRDEVNKVGRYMLDNVSTPFGTIDDIAAKALARKQAAGQTLDDLYSQAGELFKDKMSQVGFDPLRDKADIMKAAAAELGDTVGADAALNKLSKYLDQVAEKHGDAPMKEALGKYQKDVAEYLPKQRQFLKDKKAYQAQLGKAGEDLDQQVLPGTFDDFQRTGLGQRQIELHGQDPSQLAPELSNFGTQMELPGLPTGNSEAERLFARPGEANFGHLGGDTADRLGQRTVDSLEGPAQMDFLNNRTSQMMSGDLAQQGSIEGLGLTPRSFANVDEPIIQSGQGQMQFPLAPEAPMRPMRPQDIRNPMSPRRANDIKTAIDQEINYARNPLSKEPATELAFKGARRAVNEKNLQGLDDLGASDIADGIRAANKDYGLSSQVAKMAEDRINRQTANKMFGLTDTIMGGAALGYGGVTGDWKGAGAAMLAKKGFEKYGVQASAMLLDKVATSLLKSPQIAAIAQENPAAFQAMVYKFSQKLMPAEATGTFQEMLPRAADTGQNDTSFNFNQTMGKDALLQKTSGSKYGQVLQNAAQKGDHSLAAAHYVLSQRDAGYRKITEDGQ